MIEIIMLMSCHSEHAAKLLIDYKLANHAIYVSGEAEILNNGALIFS
jgi:hypothetical protein